jgi:citronellol/citronellal dehydrogenase
MGWAAVIDLNLTSVFTMCQAVRPLMQRASGGAIVNLSLSGVERGSMGIAHSVAARSGVLGLTRTLALEWAADGIRVNCLGPGTVLTSALDRYGDLPALQRLTSEVPLGRTTTVEEVAELVAFLVSPAGAMVSGQLWHVDGAAHLGPGLHMI